jgi:serine/threonine-protein kinase
VDDLARPLCYLDPTRFTEVGDTLRDPASGLAWQRGGSEFAVTWTEAPEILDGLNAARFAGRDDWRLPTAHELLTLLVPARRGEDFCLAPRFDPAQNRLWSADRASYASAWFAQAELGCLDRMDLTCLAHVRAVAG